MRISVCRQAKSWGALVVVGLLAAAAAGCEPAAVSGSEEPRVVAVESLKSLYRGYPVEVTQEVAIEGVVVGTDRYGELYQQLVVQDYTGGVIFSIDNSKLYEHYSQGDSLHIRCTGLTIGSYGNSIRLGAPPSGERQVTPLEWNRWLQAATECGVGKQPKPTRVKIATLEARNVSTLVRLDGVRFVEAGEQMAPEGESINRHIVDASSTCDTLVMRVSGHSDFGHLRLPTGECTVVGILGYFNKDYQIVVTSADDIVPTAKK